jgi:hypothetical protein
VRWWDGERWTEHLQQASQQQHDGEIRLTFKKLEIVGNAQRISFRGKDFSLAEVDRVAYRGAVNRINGAYMGTTFLLKLGRGSTHDMVLLDGGTKDQRLDEMRAVWNGLVDLVEAHASPRIVADAVATITGGGTVAFGGIVAGPDGVKAKRPLAKVVPWSEISGAEVNNLGLMQLMARRDGGSTKGKMTSGLDQWNTVLLPRVLAHFTST